MMFVDFFLFDLELVNYFPLFTIMKMIHFFDLLLVFELPLFQQLCQLPNAVFVFVLNLMHFVILSHCFFVFSSKLFDSH
jgi:hypothetical protein